MSVLKKMPPQQKFKLVGEIVSLMISSKSHENYKIADLRNVVLTLIDKNCYRIYYNEDKMPLGFVAWSSFSDEIDKKYREGKYKFNPKDINSGKNIWIVELISPFNHAKKIIEELQNKVFADDVVNALLINAKEKSLKAVKIAGVNLKKDDEKVKANSSVKNKEEKSEKVAKKEENKSKKK